MKDSMFIAMLLSKYEVEQLTLLARFLELHFTLGEISVNGEELEPIIVQTLRDIATNAQEVS